MEQFITIYAEATPNPESVKFVVNKDITLGRSGDYPDARAALASPLANELFKFSFVRGIYISQNFVTVSKDEESLWAELIPIIRTFLKEYISAGSPVFSESGAHADTKSSESDTEDVKKIKQILADSIRPVVEMDGGNIEFKSYDDGVVTLALKGSCSGCPSSTITLKNGIESLLKRMVPDVKEVVAEAL